MEAAALAFGCPRKMGQKKETFSCPTYLLSGIASGVVRSPAVQLLKHAVPFPGRSWNGGLRRRRRRVWAAVEGVAREGLLSESRPSG